MIANYHTHTYRCGHASPDHERAYIEAAIKAGFDEIGFADHCPMPVPKSVLREECPRFWEVRMALDETEDYVNTLLDMRREYKNDIKVHIGFEVEYFRDAFDGFIDFISQFPTDYIILGQHFETLKDTFWLGKEGRPESSLVNYVDLTCEAIKTGKFTYVAHPDLCNFSGPVEIYEREMTRLIKCANDHKMPLEFNFCGMQQMRHYPSLPFWQLANEIGCNVVFGSDAHDPKNMLNETVLKHAEQLVAAHKGLNLLERVKLVSPVNKI